MFAKIAVLALMAAFYICYFAKALSQKKKGIDTDQLGKGKEGFAKRIEIALKAATCVLPLVQVAAILTYRGSAPAALQISGITVTACGVLAFILSVMHMKDNWRAGVQKDAGTSLVTDGIYSVSRNPAFLGFDLMYAGILICFFSIYLCACTAAAVLLFHLQIVKVEEVFLTGAFGQEYTAYKSRVCRYLGRRR